jgi:flagellar motor switch protein FliG
MAATATATAPATTPAKASPIAGLNKVQKLAALLVVLGPEEASTILSAFNHRQMEQIMGEMAKIEFLSADVQHSLLEEFSSVTLDGVTSALGGVERAQNVLEKSLGAVKAQEVLGRVAPQASKSVALEDLRNTPPAVIAQMLRGEQSQTWALILGQLDAENSVEVFRTMEPAFRGDVMFRMARMEPVSPEVLEMLVKSLLARRSPASTQNQVAANGTQFLTEVMKRFDRQAASDALEMLAKEDPELSAAIRKGMFIFEDLTQLDQQTMGTILREIDFNTLAIAMKDCSEKLREMIFKGITKRAAEGLEENLKFMTKVRRKEVEEARTKVMAQIFDLERKGEINLTPEDASASAA